MANRFRGRCDTHNWEGHTQESRDAAERDVKVHKDTYPGEGPHQTRVISWTED